MAKTWAKQFYKSKQWQQCRESYIAKVHGLCERCNEKGIITPGKIVHHTVYLSPENINNPEISLNHELLEYLCQNHHNSEHHGESEVLVEGLMFDREGNLIQINGGFDNERNNTEL
jgi:5-methylcytosine-specific restriction protein A